MAPLHESELLILLRGMTMMTLKSKMTYGSDVPTLVLLTNLLTAVSVFLDYYAQPLQCVDDSRERSIGG